TSNGTRSGHSAASLPQLDRLKAACTTKAPCRWLHVRTRPAGPFHAAPYDLNQCVRVIEDRKWIKRPTVMSGRGEMMLSNFIVPDSSDPRLGSRYRYRMLVDGKSV